VRDVREERPERDDELDAEIVREPGDETAEGPPAEVRLRPEEQHDVTRRPRQPGGEEGVLGPVDPSRLALGEGDVRARRLEVEEELGSISAKRSAFHARARKLPARDAP